MYCLSQRTLKQHFTQVLDKDRSNISQLVNQPRYHTNSTNCHMALAGAATWTAQPPPFTRDPVSYRQATAVITSTAAVAGNYASTSRSTRVAMPQERELTDDT